MIGSLKFKGTYSSATKAWSGAKDAFKGILQTLKPRSRALQTGLTKHLVRHGQKLRLYFPQRARFLMALKKASTKPLRLLLIR